MTKDMFSEELAQAMQVTDAEIEMQYWFTLNERREMYLAYLHKQVEEMPESHFFSADFEAWMQEQIAERAKTLSETFIERRNKAKAIEDMDNDFSFNTIDLQEKSK